MRVAKDFGSYIQYQLDFIMIIAYMGENSIVLHDRSFIFIT